MKYSKYLLFIMLSIFMNTYNMKKDSVILNIDARKILEEMHIGKKPNRPLCMVIAEEAFIHNGSKKQLSLNWESTQLDAQNKPQYSRCVFVQNSNRVTFVNLKKEKVNKETSTLLTLYLHLHLSDNTLSYSYFPKDLAHIYLYKLHQRTRFKPSAIYKEPIE